MGKKVQLEVERDGCRRKIASLEERGSGDLTIIFRTGLNHEDPTKGDIPIKLEKISVHKSKADIGNFVKHERRLADGRSLTSVLYSHVDKDLFCTPIFAAAYSDLSHSSYDPSDKKGFIHTVLTDKITNDATMVVHLYATHNSIELPELENKTLFSYRLNSFSLWVYVGFINLPPLNFSRFLIPASSNLRSGSQDITDINFSGKGTSGVLTKAIPFLVHNNDERLASLKIKGICDVLGIPMKEFPDFRLYYTIRPLSTSPMTLLFEAPFKPASISKDPNEKSNAGEF